MTTGQCVARYQSTFSKIMFTASIWMMLFLHWCPAGAGAADDSGDNTSTMAPVVVTATRSPESEQDLAANITVVTSDQLDQMSATSVAQALEYIPGISVQFNGGPGSDAGGVRIQGSEIRHVAVYQDGIPLNQLINPRTDLSFLPLAVVERIEIYKGAASSAWGSALGGVVNIITKEPAPGKPFNANAQASYGCFDTLKSRAAISGAQNKLGWLLSYTHEQNNGFIEHTEYQLDGIYAKLNYDISETGRINLALAHNDKQNADPIINYEDYGTERFWDDIRGRHSYQRLLFETAPTGDMLLTLEGRHRESKSTIDDVYPDRKERYLDYREELWGASLRLKWQAFSADTVVAGFDGDRGHFEWEPFIGKRQTDHTNEWAVYIIDTHNRGALSINAGARYDYNEDYQDAFSPSLGAVYRFDVLDALVRAQVAGGFSAPDFAWVHNPTYGNPDLEPEVAINYQMGGEIQPLKWLHMELNLFRSDVDDLIQYDRYDTMHYQNIEKSTREGVEWELAASFDIRVTLRVAGCYTDVEDDDTGRTIQDIPRTQHNISLLYAKGGFSNSLLGKYIDNNSSYAETRDKVFRFDYQFKFKLPAAEKKGGWNLYGAVYNIFNSTYLYREVWPQPGRWAEAGVRFEY